MKLTILKNSIRENAQATQSERDCCFGYVIKTIFWLLNE